MVPTAQQEGHPLLVCSNAASFEVLLKPFPAIRSRRSVAAETLQASVVLYVGDQPEIGRSTAKLNIEDGKVSSLVAKYDPWSTRRIMGPHVELHAYEPAEQLPAELFG